MNASEKARALNEYRGSGLPHLSGLRKIKVSGPC